MLDIGAFLSRDCVTCETYPLESRDEGGFFILCPTCGSRTGSWSRLRDAWLEWEQITNKC